MRGHLVTVLTSCCLAIGGWAVLLLVDMDKKVAVLETSVAETNRKVGKNYDLIKIVLTEVRPVSEVFSHSTEGRLR
jgi:hypothetical protein|tara:strand:+ start:151 stop:378 length:228 start_codon:yes stop_codon:yes gene_type:complete